MLPTKKSQPAGVFFILFQTNTLCCGDKGFNKQKTPIKGVL